jgi:hypothetical protein
LIGAAIYPRGTYSWPVIGSMQDLAAATVDDVKKFFGCKPNNDARRVGRLQSGDPKGWIKK